MDAHIRKRNSSLSKLTTTTKTTIITEMKTTNKNDKNNNNDDDAKPDNKNKLIILPDKNKNSEIKNISFIIKSFIRENQYIIMIRKNFIKIILILILLLLLFIFIVIPFIIRNSLALQRLGVFMNVVNLHYFYNLSDIKQFGFNCAKSFRIKNEYNDGSIIELGAWHLFPIDENDEECNRDVNDFNDDHLIFLYLHGNMGSRAFLHRRLLYKKLNEKFNAHVIAFDYRGYADSTNTVPSTFGLTNDTKNIYEWIINNNVSSDRIIIWSHSLGTGVATRFLSECPDEIYPLTAVIESGFTSVPAASVKYLMIRIFSFLPYFNYCFVEPLVNNPDLNFNSTERLSNIRCPLLMLHAKDDPIVSYEFGYQLYQQAKQLQPKNVAEKTKFISYPAHLGYGHHNIYLDDSLFDNLNEFIKSFKK